MVTEKKVNEVLETLRALYNDARGDLNAACKRALQAALRDNRADTARTRDRVAQATWACEEAEAAFEAARAAYYAALDVLAALDEDDQ